jgi:hypothetical protein
MIPPDRYPQSRSHQTWRAAATEGSQFNGKVWGKQPRPSRSSGGEPAPQGAHPLPRTPQSCYAAIPYQVPEEFLKRHQACAYCPKRSDFTMRRCCSVFDLSFCCLP